MIYKYLRYILFVVDAEWIHNIMHGIGAFFSAQKVIWKTLALVLRRTRPSIGSTVAGIYFSSPVGLAAGFDKPGNMIDLVYSLDFGFTEVGTVTPRPQLGNPKKRLFRLPQDHAILNRMGFNNEGIERFVLALQKRRSGIIVGGNIGKNKDTPIENAADDYASCAQRISLYVDYITINVSSPNTPGLRSLQGASELRKIIQAVKQHTSSLKKRVPIFLKIAPDMDDAFFHALLDVLQETHCDGVIISNTTLSRDGLRTDASTVASFGDGGISGAPLKERATQCISECYRYTHGKIPIIGVGGIFTAEDAYEKIRAGASLIQIYTGLIYEGPFLARRLNRGIERLLKRDGFRAIMDAVGSAHRTL